MVTLWKNIGALRGAAIICVVLNHAILSLRSVHQSWAGGMLPYTVVDQAILTLGCTFPAASVAGFMIAAGYSAGRFSYTWPAARAVVRAISARYVAWSIMGFIALGMLKQQFSGEEIILEMISNWGPFPAYWFFASLILFSLLTPWLTTLAKARPRALFTVFIVTEVARSVFYYSGAPISNLLTPLQGSYFLLGVLLSQHSTVVVKALVPHRRHILIAAMLMFGVACLEMTYQWNVAGFPSGQVISSDRTAMRLYAVLISTWVLLQEMRPSTVSSFLDKVGMRSLAIFLSFDFFQWCALSILWHFPGQALHTQTPDLLPPPAFLGNPAWILLYFSVGLLGPVSAVALLQRLGGTRWRRLVFG